MSILERVVTFVEAIVRSYHLYEACHFPSYVSLATTSVNSYSSRASLPKAVIDVKYGSAFKSTVLYLSILWAIGRKPNTEHLGLEGVGVKLDKAGNVIVDDYQETNVNGVFSIGDVQGKALLTPVAIAAGRRLSNRLYGGEKFKNDKLDYQNIATVVFS